MVSPNRLPGLSPSLLQVPGRPLLSEAQIKQAEAQGFESADVEILERALKVSRKRLSGVEGFLRTSGGLRLPLFLRT